MEAFELPKNNRTDRFTLNVEHEAITERYAAMAREVAKDVIQKKKDLYAEDVAFRQLAGNFLKTLKPGALLHVRTQVGPMGGDIIHDYPDAVLEHVNVIRGEVNTFNVSTPAKGVFTIGMSCLQYISLR